MCGHQGGGPHGGGLGGGFSFEWVDVGAKKKLKIWIWNSNRLGASYLIAGARRALPQNNVRTILDGAGFLTFGFSSDGSS